LLLCQNQSLCLRDAAKTPLTFDEKKDLIAQIHKLPADNMQVVIEIIQAAMPQTDGEEIEVPLDDLDTQTLRKLQNFVDVRILLILLLFFLTLI